VIFVKKDAWLGEDMNIKVGALRLDANNMAFSGNKYEINSLLIKDPVVALHSYTKLKPALATVIPGEEADTTATWNKAKTVFKIADLKIINGTFSTNKETDRQAYAHFDGQHILFTEINANLNNSTFVVILFCKIEIDG
jgi:hypothetical protein